MAGKETIMSETVPTAETVCLRCGGSDLLPAHLEHPIAFCVDHATHHGRVHLSLKARLCRDCGHVEFWMPDPSQIARRDAPAAAIQEEDF